jgi:hypothetical protein
MLLCQEKQALLEFRNAKLPAFALRASARQAPPSRCALGAQALTGRWLPALAGRLSSAFDVSAANPAAPEREARRRGGTPS